MDLLNSNNRNARLRKKGDPQGSPFLLVLGFSIENQKSKIDNRKSTI